MAITHLVFDLDETLYPYGLNFWHEIGANITRFLVEHLGLDEAGATALRMHYLSTYGTTLRGIVLNHPEIEPADFLAYVHAVDVATHLTPDPALDAMLAALPVPKSIFTNSDTRHTARVLHQLGISRHFGHIVDITAMHYNNKPLPQAYDTLLGTVRADPRELIFFEDRPANLEPAKALGMTTVLLGPRGDTSLPYVDYHFDRVTDAAPLLQSLVVG